jgi:hypothetical protein
MKKSEIERTEAIAHLRLYLHPGTTVYTVLRHCSASGMMREISLHTIDCSNPEHPLSSWTWHAARALGSKLGKHDGIRVPGCGMDMGFHLVYTLSQTLFFDSEMPYRDAGYALKQRWI